MSQELTLNIENQKKEREKYSNFLLKNMVDSNNITWLITVFWGLSVAISIFAVSLLPMLKYLFVTLVVFMSMAALVGLYFSLTSKTYTLASEKEERKLFSYLTYDQDMKKAVQDFKKEQGFLTKEQVDELRIQYTLRNED